MQKRDASPAGSRARGLIDELVAVPAAGGQCRVEIGYPVADMMDARTPAGQELGDRTGWFGGRQELDFRLPEWEGNDRGAVDLFSPVRLKTEHVAVKAQRLLEIAHRHSDVSEARPGVGTGGFGHEARR